MKINRRSSCPGTVQRTPSEDPIDKDLLSVIHKDAYPKGIPSGQHDKLSVIYSNLIPNVVIEEMDYVFFHVQLWLLVHDQNILSLIQVRLIILSGLIVAIVHSYLYINRSGRLNP